MIMYVFCFLILGFTDNFTEEGRSFSCSGFPQKSLKRKIFGCWSDKVHRFGVKES